MMAIRFIHREKSLDGEPVNGHKTRMKLLVDEIRQQYPMVFVELGLPKKNERWGDIVVSDGLPVDVPRNVKYVFIDSGHTNYLPYPNRLIDLYINPDLGARKIPDGYIKSAMMGSDFAILNKTVFDYKLPFFDTDIMFCPGGNKTVFWDRIGELSTSLSYSFSDDSNEAQYDFLDRMRKTRVIVATPSVTMMEAMAMGKPVFLVQTSVDQKQNMLHALEYGLAQAFFSVEQVENMFSDSSLENLRNNARNYMKTAKNGTKRVAEAILELL